MDAFLNACLEGNEDVVAVLLPTIDPREQQNKSIKWASKHGHAKVVEALLQDGRADPTADDNYAITIASEKGHAKVVEALLQDGRADPTADDNYHS